MYNNIFCDRNFFILLFIYVCGCLFCVFSVMILFRACNWPSAVVSDRH